MLTLNSSSSVICHKRSDLRPNFEKHISSHSFFSSVFKKAEDRRWHIGVASWIQNTQADSCTILVPRAKTGPFSDSKKSYQMYLPRCRWWTRVLFSIREKGMRICGAYILAEWKRWLQNTQRVVLLVRLGTNNKLIMDVLQFLNVYHVNFNLHIWDIRRL